MRARLGENPPVNRGICPRFCLSDRGKSGILQPSGGILDPVDELSLTRCLGIGSFEVSPRFQTCRPCCFRRGVCRVISVVGTRRDVMQQTGTVKFFNQTKGYGFITPDEGGKDVFVHISAVERSGLPALDEGMRVSFETEADPRGKGPKAVNLSMSA